MHARDIMTTPVVTVLPDTPVRDVAARLLAHRISAVPVVDAGGALAGIVSEGDLLRRAETGTAQPRSWWLNLLATPEERAAEYVKTHGRCAADVMTRDVVTVTEDAGIAEIAALLEKRRIKRVPVLRDGRLAGIVSRANLLQGLASGPAATPSANDRSLRGQVLDAIREIGGGQEYIYNVVVTGGTVQLWGTVDSQEERRALTVAAENVPGVERVEDHLGTLPRNLGGA